MKRTQRWRVTSSAAARHISSVRAGNLISKANACASTAALHDATLQPAQQRYTRNGSQRKQRAHTLQVGAKVSIRKMIQYTFNRILVRKKWCRICRNTVAAAPRAETRDAVQIPAPHDTTVLLPFLERIKKTGQALQGQVEAQQRFVPRPCWLTGEQLPSLRCQF
jgi:hypothetical protein